MARKGTPLSDEELLAAIDAAEALALGSNESTVSTDREDAIARYLGKPYTGDLAAPPGRSSVTSRDVADVVEGVLANVIKPFVGGEEVVRFDPLGPDDEERAQQETDYVNWVALERNNGFLTLNAAMKDALLLRAGYVKMGWTKRADVILETYQGLSDDELGMIAQDTEVEIVAHSAYPDPNWMPPQGAPQQMMAAPSMVHDVKLRRAKPTEYVETMPCPPEEVLVSQRQRTPGLQEADFVQHRTRKTLSELRQMGYDVEDDITDDDSGETVEEMARQRESSGAWDDNTQDRARRPVLFKESWLRVDKDGDGIAELRRVCQVGRTLLADEETDIVPIAAFCPILMPHQHAGVSIFDMVEDLAKLKTALMRQFMDNKYLSNNSRVFANENVNIDDLLVSRPGGVVRVMGTAPISDSAQPWVVPDTGASALQGLEYLDAVRESRTGYTRQSQGLETDALVSKTVGGMQMQLSQSQLRLEMIARTLAETGVREMFKIIHALTLKHSTRAEKVRLRNKWVDINPREWVRRTDLSIAVGIGSASQQTMMAGLTMIGQVQGQLRPLGLVTVTNAYNTAKKIINAAGFRNAEEFVTPPKTDPQTGEPQEPPPQPPEAVLVEQERQKGAQSLAQMKHQTDQMMEQGKAMLKQKELELQAMLKKADQEGALALQQSNDMRQSALDQQKSELDAQFKQAELDAKIQIANISAATSVQVAQIGAGVDDGSVLIRQQEAAAGYTPVMQKLDHVMAMLSTPRELVRGEDGKVAGVKGAPVPAPPPSVEAKDVVSKQDQLLADAESKKDQLLSDAAARHQQLLEHLAHVANMVSAPKEIVRDANGRAVGVRPATLQ